MLGSREVGNVGSLSVPSTTAAVAVSEMVLILLNNGREAPFRLDSKSVISALPEPPNRGLFSAITAIKLR